MSFLADFHIHSHFSIATSKDCDPEHLFLWACLKGITLVGTGDFTHPGWLDELGQKLVPAQEGLFRLRPEYEAPILDRIPKSCHQDVRFILSCEISSIYKKGGKTRKVHNCLMVPTFEEARAISRHLEKIGNIRADGRPILGLDSHDLLEIMLEESPQGIFIPAHIWTPHFSLFGAYSGFDTVEECFGDLSGHIWALETGLSSDPPMNWRLSSLDSYILVSNSDAHSPKNLAREANILGCELSFPAIRSAIKEKDNKQFLGTVEFFPQEGKYHYNGHRNCGVSMSPEETINLNGICPKCGKQLTLGVMHRVAELADRTGGFIPPGAPPFKSLIPLIEILADYFECGKNSKRINHSYFNLIQRLGNEWQILTLVPVEELKRYAGPALAEGIERVRKGDVIIRPGFDGEYGAISVFSPEDRIGKKTQISLFKRIEDPESGLPRALSGKLSKTQALSGKLSKTENTHPRPCPPPPCQEKPAKAEGTQPEKNKNTSAITDRIPEQLNLEQLKAVQASPGPVLVIAGPGTGKTRTLAWRITYLIKSAGASPDEIMAVTFTNKAAKEMKLRLLSASENLPLMAQGPFIGTFHQFCIGILKTCGPVKGFILFHTHDSLGLIESILKNTKGKTPLKARDCFQEISLLKVRQEEGDLHEPPDPVFYKIYKEYQENLKRYNAYDYDDLLLNTVKLLGGNSDILQALKSRYRHILVDEFQDVNPVQYTLVKLLAGEKGEGLFVIGDPNQSIYGFRGADNMLCPLLREEFPGAQIHTLNSNYRTTRPIIDSATRVISNNPQPAPLKLRSVRGNGPSIQVMEFPSEKAEGIAIVKEITALMGGIDMLQAHGDMRQAHGDMLQAHDDTLQAYGDTLQAHDEAGKSQKGATLNTRSEYGFSDFAILFRTARQADVLEECLIKEGMPYQLVGHKGILENPTVRQILAILRWANHPQDEHSLKQGLDLPLFSVTKKKKASILKWLINNYGQKTGNPLNPSFIPDPEIRSVAEAFTLYRQIIGEKSPAHLIDLLITQLKGQNPAKGNQKDLKRLGLLAEEFTDIPSFLESVTLYREGDISWKGSKEAKGTEMINLITLHASKGLEFPVVFICGCEDGLLPYRRPDKSDNSTLEEERRLFYVGMTRAKDRLYLSSSRIRILHGKKQNTRVSPFIEEIPKTFYEKALFSPFTPPKPQHKQLSLW